MAPTTLARRRALLALAAAVAGGCTLAPRGTRDERLRLADAGRAWDAPVAARVLPELPAAPDWRDCLRRAFLANGDLEAAWRAWQAAVARIDVASAYPNTNLAVGYEYAFSGGSLKAWDRSTVSVGFDPMQNLSFPTKVLAAGRVALAEARAEGERFLAMKFDLQRRVLDAWLAHALTAEKLRLQRETLALARLGAQSAAGRVEAGATGRELFEAEVEAALAEDALARLEAELRGERAALNGLLGRAPEAPLAPPAALPAPRPLPADDARLLATAAAASPDLAALAHAATAREHALDFAKQQLIPDFNPFGGFTGSLEQVAGIMASLPIRVPMILGAVRESRALLARAEATARQARLDRDAAFVATLAALRDAERQAALVRDRVLPAAERTLASARGAYTAGGLGYPELAAAERLMLELRGLLAEARIARERRLAELEALAGLDVETLA